MELTKHFAAGIAMGLMLAACAGVSFPYHYYGLDLKDQKLLGPTIQDDVDLAVCDATSADQSPCTAMMTSDYMALKQDYLNTKNQLNDCQQNLAAK